MTNIFHLIYRATFVSTPRKIVLRFSRQCHQQMMNLSQKNSQVKCRFVCRRCCVARRQRQFAKGNPLYGLARLSHPGGVLRAEVTLLVDNCQVSYTGQFFFSCNLCHNFILRKVLQNLPKCNIVTSLAVFERLASLATRRSKRNIANCSYTS